MAHWILLIESGDVKISLLPLLAKQDSTVKVVATLIDMLGTLKQFWPDVVIINGLSAAPKAIKAQLALYHTQLEQEHACLLVTSPETEAELAPETLPAPVCTSSTLWQHVLQTVGQKRFIRVDGLVLDMRNRSMLYQGHIHKMTPKLLNLFRLLLEHHGEIVSRRTLMKDVWETDYMGDTRTLDVHIRWAREKIEKDPSHPQYLLTVRGQGYRLTLDGKAS